MAILPSGSWFYHPLLGARLVRSDAEAAALGPGWTNSPAAFTLAELGLSLQAVGDHSSVVSDRLSTNIAYYIVWSPGCSAGRLSVVSAHDPVYTGTWGLLASIPYVGPNRVDYYSLAGLHAAHKVEVAEAIIGGTVTVHGIRL